MQPDTFVEVFISWPDYAHFTLLHGSLHGVPVSILCVSHASLVFVSDIGVGRLCVRAHGGDLARVEESQTGCRGRVGGEADSERGL